MLSQHVLSEGIARGGGAGGEASPPRHGIGHFEATFIKATGRGLKVRSEPLIITDTILGLINMLAGPELRGRQEGSELGSWTSTLDTHTQGRTSPRGFSLCVL